MNLISTKLCKVMVALFLPLFALAQSQTPMEQALRFIEQNHAEWGLNAEDIDNLQVSDMYKTQHNGVTHIYFQQSINRTPIYNAIAGVHISKDGEAYMAGHRLIAEASAKVASSARSITPAQALLAATQHLGIENAAIQPINDETESGDATVFSGANFSRSDITVTPCYVMTKDGQLRSAWDLAIDDNRNPDYWSLRVDAGTGNVTDQTNWTNYCEFDHAHSDCGHEIHDTRTSFQSVEDATAAAASGSYRVFALPAESPSHGPHVLVTNPHMPGSSPFGWHDVDGSGTPNYTITRGNNVHAYPDLNDNDQSTGGEPEGGPSLVFDEPYDGATAPIDQLETAVINLFYMSNMVHDVTYIFGFDEEAGNFQANNFGNGGRGGDHVNSEAQDGSGTNNANFSTPPDGGSGRMQMYVWNSGGEVFQVTAPPAVSGGYESADASFGPNIITNNIDIEAEIVIARDADPDNPTFACGDIENAAELDGKIALIDRGGCFFDLKTINAQNAGAVAVIVCNFDPSPAGMGPSGTQPDPDIPAISLGSQDCEKIRVWVGQGLTGKIKAPEGNLVDLDGDFDNGIIAHEYGHGISNRLTGGPSLAGCLGNAEQMGEGWSDYFSLVMTVEPGDQGSEGRGIGTYAQRQPVEGGGIRPRPYSTDFSINEMTYSFLQDEAGISQPHGIGSVWCTMLWDMYWALTEKHGWDADFNNAAAGNNIAIQLVMDGMKLQACSPGFVDGRDAILLADTLNNNAENACLLWEVFARRGLGYYADQGDSDDRGDGIEDFEVAPLCQNKIRIVKEAPTLVEPGEEFEYKITVANNKGSVSNNVVVTDILADGLEYVDGTANFPPVFVGNQIRFELGDMASLQEQVITYSVKASESLASSTVWFDDMESGEDSWDIDLREGFSIWYSQDEYAYSGDVAFYTENEDMESDQLLIQFEPIELDVDNPGMRFYHWFSTAIDGNNIDGGLVQVSTDGASWQYIRDAQMLRNGYSRPLPYGTFTIPNLSGFAGNSGGFIDTYVDLGAYKDQDVQVRFRFGTEEGGNDNNNLALPAGWVVDDVEYLDLFFYNTAVRVTSENGDDEMAVLPGKGTLVEPKLGVDAEDLPTIIEKVFVYPNPAVEEARIRMDVKTATPATIIMYAEDGRPVRNINIGLREGIQVVALDVSELPTGTYFIEVTTDAGSFTRPLMKR